MAATLRARASCARAAARALGRRRHAPHRFDVGARTRGQAADRHDGRRARARRGARRFEPLLEHGYVHEPHRPGIAHHFAKPSYSLHLTEPRSDLWRERLAFRDALRRDRMLAEEYAALKLRLAREYTDDPAAYTAGKREFVGRALADAGLTFGRR